MSSANDQELRGSSTGELVKHLGEQVSELIRQELELAKAELSEKAREAGTGAGMLGGAGVVALLALGSFTAFLILLLSQAMEAWVAALIVTVIYAAIAGAVAVMGRERVKEGTPPTPEQTVETVKEDVQWAKRQATSARR